jgi:plasmid stabilization system protein ParE
MDWQVVFSLRSKKDLQKVVEFITRDDPAAARRFGSTLIAKAESLADAPEIGPILPQKPTTRFFPVGAYLIIYRLDTERRVIRILRFWHAARRERPSG